MKSEHLMFNLQGAFIARREGVMEESIEERLWGIAKALKMIGAKENADLLMKLSHYCKKKGIESEDDLIQETQDGER